MRTARALLLVIVGFAAGCADTLILPGNHEVIHPIGLRRRVFQVGGKSVEVWITRSPGAIDRLPRAYVLFFGGNGDRAERWLPVLAGNWGQKPVELWGMNYPGFGGSQGPTRLVEIAPDALTVYDALRNEAGARPIFLRGNSFGTTVALCVAARRPVSGLVLQNPPPLRQLILGYYGWWNLWLVARPVASHVPSELDSLINGSHCRAPAIFVLSSSDGVVPPKYHQLVVDAYAGPKKVIDVPGAGHNDPLTKKAAEQLQFLEESMWDAAVRK